MDKKFDKHPDIIYRVINGKPVIMNFKTGNVMTLNELGSIIWEKLPDCLSKIIEAIVSEYDVSKAKVQQDVSEFLDVLKQENFIVVHRHKENPSPRSPFIPMGEFASIEKIENLGTQEGIPIIAKFELLYHCNFSCIHCFNITERERERARGTLETEAVKHIIDQLYDIGTMLISFTGGEIFLRKDIWEIIEYAHRKNFLIELLTSAALMTEQDVERLKNFRISNVQISIYSHIPDVHDSVTGTRGSYNESIKTIRCLAANNINTSIVTPLMKINFHDYRKIRELARQMGVNHHYAYTIFERDDGSKDVYDLRISIDEIRQFFSENPDEIPYKKRNINQPLCHAGVNQCSISPFGDVSPCFHSLLPIYLGNLTEQSLGEIWRQSEDLENFRNLKIGHLNQCPGCAAIHNCSICPGMNVRANDNLLEPARVCCDHAFSAKEVVDDLSIDLEAKEAKRLEDFH